MDPKDRLETVAKTKMGARREKASDSEDGPPTSAFRLDPSQIEQFVAAWPPAPKKVAEELIGRYGAPDEATPNLLIWHHDSGPWVRTMVTSDETAHDFPTPHTDFISQTINYDVPVEKLAELAEFDGSVIVYRTAGQVTLSCDNEAANFLAANLMHDVVVGNRTVEEARREFADQTAAWTLNRPAPYTEGIRFELPASPQTGYLDEPILKQSAAKQTVEKVKDVVGLNRQT